jgi:hypothetical protein
MATRHRQVPLLWFTCDEELAELITLINRCGTTTTNSCQDDGDGGRGAVRARYSRRHHTASSPRSRREQAHDQSKQPKAVEG